ncbi:MAG: hypothetical protein WC869_06585 [Phycisphaerae bacterium]|jgi:hypothetical protein
MNQAKSNVFLGLSIMAWTLIVAGASLVAPQFGIDCASAAGDNASPDLQQRVDAAPSSRPADSCPCAAGKSPCTQRTSACSRPSCSQPTTCPGAKAGRRPGELAYPNQPPARPESSDGQPAIYAPGATIEDVSRPLGTYSGPAEQTYGTDGAGNRILTTGSDPNTGTGPSQYASDLLSNPSTSQPVIMYDPSPQYYPRPCPRRR